MTSKREKEVKPNLNSSLTNVNELPVYNEVFRINSAKQLSYIYFFK